MPFLRPQNFSKSTSYDFLGFKIALDNFQKQVDQMSNAGNTINVIETNQENDVVLESEFPPESPLIGLHSDSD